MVYMFLNGHCYLKLNIKRRRSKDIRCLLQSFRREREGEGERERGFFEQE